jgi:hypothetical protein
MNDVLQLLRKPMNGAVNRAVNEAVNGDGMRND